MAGKKSIRTSIELNNGTYPVMVYFEKRTSARAAVGTKQLILRCPQQMNKKQRAETWAWFVEWVRQLEKEKPNALKHFHHKIYQNGMVLDVGERNYRLYLTYDDRKTATGHLASPNRIELKLPLGLDNYSSNKAIKTLCSRIVAQDFLPAIKARVLALNKQFFQKEIRDVRLKYNSSNWGSCSSNKIINLSTRLLFAPKAVIDYVIIHELAHLIEANHSHRFWKLVADAMPNYKEMEKWLKDHGKDCDF